MTSYSIIHYYKSFCDVIVLLTRDHVTTDLWLASYYAKESRFSNVFCGGRVVEMSFSVTLKLRCLSKIPGQYVFSLNKW